MTGRPIRYECSAVDHSADHGLILDPKEFAGLSDEMIQDEIISVQRERIEIVVTVDPADLESFIAAVRQAETS